jgi:hypothetical protein
VAEDPIVLCEGYDDAEFFRELIRVRGLPALDVREPKREDHGGYSGFGRRLVALGTETDLAKRRAIIIARDCNADPGDAFHNLVTQIREAPGYGVPEAPRRLTPSQNELLPPLCVLMLPSNDRPGALETLCYESAAARRPEIARCIDEYVRCVQFDLARWGAVKHDKFRLRCLLSAACPSEPNTSLRYAWTREKGRPGDLVPLDHCCFNDIANFLSEFVGTLEARL